MVPLVVSPLRAWTYRYVLALVLASILMATGISAGWWYINHKLDGAETIELDLDVGQGTFLILGSDSRAFIDNPQDAASFGSVGGTRADTILVVKVDADGKRALLVSFPRDLWVEIPGKGHAKINSSFADGPQGVINTLRHNFDIPINHYVEVDFAGFRNIVNAMGGVEMFVPAPARDSKTGLDIPQPGCVTLDGVQALAWVRSRQYQYFEAGGWRSDPTGDFGRITRQQDFLRRLMAQAIDAGASNPLRGNRVVDRVLDNIKLDSELSPGSILDLAEVFRSADPSEVEMVTVPAVNASRASQSVVLIKEDEAAPLFERLRGVGGQPGEVAPANVRVQVLNGAGTAQLASNTANQLQQHGFNPAGAGDADKFSYAETELRYREGARAHAELLRSYLGVGRLVESGDLGNVDVVAVLGRDFQSVREPPPEESLGGLQPVVSVRGQSNTTAPPSGTGETPEC